MLLSVPSLLSSFIALSFEEFLNGDDQDWHSVANGEEGTWGHAVSPAGWAPHRVVRGGSSASVPASLTGGHILGTFSELRCKQDSERGDVSGDHRIWDEPCDFGQSAEGSRTSASLY